MNRINVRLTLVYIYHSCVTEQHICHEYSTQEISPVFCITMNTKYYRQTQIFIIMM